METSLSSISRRFDRNVRHALLATATAVAFGAVAQPAQRTPPPLTVVFNDCTEFAGLGSLPAVQIQGLVRAGYSPANFGPGVAGLVARAARCEAISVGGSPAERGTVSQIGINLVSPDGTGDINNYALLYVTDSHRLAERLGASACRPAWTRG
jgi:hypothetical protein